MKAIFILLLTLLVSGAVSAQQYDQRLLNAYSTEELASISQEKPELLNILNYALDNACYFTEAIGKDFSVFPAIDLTDSKKVPCFAELGIKIIEDKSQFFRINGTNKVLVVKSGIVLKYELINSKK
jgi:hypothetical protein